ncbi:hypothetical protein NBRGN_099_00610 [Nocardia brasiliensis NBRC 14402]|nr:hypothetical protein NBRGN_099_00610 [Nocardia brasiliensis NBRC 14402]
MPEPAPPRPWQLRDTRTLRQGADTNRGRFSPPSATDVHPVRCTDETRTLPSVSGPKLDKWASLPLCRTWSGLPVAADGDKNRAATRAVHRVASAHALFRGNENGVDGATRRCCRIRVGGGSARLSVRRRLGR